MRVSLRLARSQSDPWPSQGKAPATWVPRSRGSRGNWSREGEADSEAQRGWGRPQSSGLSRKGGLVPNIPAAPRRPMAHGLAFQKKAKSFFFFFK